jgi:large subunit ribosomal protein L24
MMRKIKKNDEIIVIAGKDKGKTGKITRIVSDKRVLVENINIVKRHTKANPQKGIAGGILDKEMPIDVSNIAILNSATGKADKVGFKILEDGKKVRIFKSNNEVIDI